jgi:hypothetical protein
VVVGRANHIVYVGGMQEKANRKHDAKSKARKYAATNVFRATCKNDKTTKKNGHLEIRRTFSHWWFHGACDLGLRILILTPSTARLTK